MHSGGKSDSTLTNQKQRQWHFGQSDSVEALKRFSLLTILLAVKSLQIYTLKNWDTHTLYLCVQWLKHKTQKKLWPGAPGCVECRSSRGPAWSAEAAGGRSCRARPPPSACGDQPPLSHCWPLRLLTPSWPSSLRAWGARPGPGPLRRSLNRRTLSWGSSSERAGNSSPAMIHFFDNFHSHTFKIIFVHFSYPSTTAYLPWARS